MRVFLGAPYIFSTVDTSGAVFLAWAPGGAAPLPPWLRHWRNVLRDPVHANPESRDWETDPGLQSLAGTMRGIMNELSETHPSGFIKYTRMDMTKFRELVEMVRSAVQKKDTNMRLLVSVIKGQAVTILYLATKKCSL
jgi:hypothetical protein